MDTARDDELISCEANLAAAYWIWCDRGFELLQTNQYEAAMGAFERAIAIMPERPEAWHHTGEALVNLMKYYDALVCLDRAARLAPKRYKTWLMRAVVLLHLGHYDDALTSCNVVLELMPQHQEAWLLKATALQRLGQHQAAYDSFDRAAGGQRSPLWRRIAHAMDDLIHPEQATQEWVT